MPNIYSYNWKVIQALKEGIFLPVTPSSLTLIGISSRHIFKRLMAFSLLLPASLKSHKYYSYKGHQFLIFTPYHNGSWGTDLPKETIEALINGIDVFALENQVRKKEKSS